MLFVTHAGLYPEEANREATLAVFDAYGRRRGATLKEYAIGKEKHHDPSHPERTDHIHSVLWWDKPINIKNRRFFKGFDMRGRDGRVLHPEVMSVGDDPLDRVTLLRCVRTFVVITSAQMRS